MNFQEKLIKLRRAAALSQEELAERLGVSRQAVSKWESGQSAPEIDKIVMLSELFGVSTDYLLKEGAGTSRGGDEEGGKAAHICDTPAEEAALPAIGASDTRAFLAAKKRAALMTAAAVLLFILSPALLIIEAGLVENGSMNEYSGVIIGLTWLFCAIISGVALCIAADFATKDSPLRDAGAALDAEALALVKAERDASSSLFTLFYIIGTALCIVSPLPLIIAALLTELHLEDRAAQALILLLTTALLLVLVSIGVFFLTYAAIRDETHKKLMASTKETRRGRALNTVIGVYWELVVAAYFIVSFITGRWDLTWIIWPLSPIIPNIITKLFGKR